MKEVTGDYHDFTTSRPEFGCTCQQLVENDLEAGVYTVFVCGRES
jgi:hypothetical protein